MNPRWISLLLATLAATPAAAGASEWNRSFTVSGRPAVRVRTDEGQVRITTASGKQVKVHVVTTGWEIGKDLEVEARQIGNTVEVVAMAPKLEWEFFVRTRTLRIDVVMPRDADVDVTTDDGGVELDPIVGAVEIHTGDGAIRARGLKGNLVLTTADGNIEAEDLDGKLHASAADGAIRVHGRFDAVDVQTGDGRVTVEAARGSTMGDGWSVRTSDGSVILRFADPPRCDLDAHASDGGVAVGFPVKVQGDLSRRQIRGPMNGGGPPLRVRTGDGSIRIEKL